LGSRPNYPGQTIGYRREREHEIEKRKEESSLRQNWVLPWETWIPKEIPKDAGKGKEGGGRGERGGGLATICLPVARARGGKKKKRGGRNFLADILNASQGGKGKRGGRRANWPKVLIIVIRRELGRGKKEGKERRKGTTKR